MLTASVEVLGCINLGNGGKINQFFDLVFKNTCHATIPESLCATKVVNLHKNIKIFILSCIQGFDNMSNKDAERDEIVDETHESQDTESDVIDDKEGEGEGEDDDALDDIDFDEEEEDSDDFTGDNKESA